MKMKSATIDGVTINFPAGPMPSPERVAELTAAFNRVKNSEHWKAPIDVVVLVESRIELDTILEAIEFFTATPGTAKFVTGDEYGEANWHVTAPGYFAGPAN